MQQIVNIPYLAQVLKTEKFSEVYGNLDLTILDANLAIWDSIKAGEIEVNEEEDTIKVLVPVVPSSDADLGNKLLRTIQHYAENDTIISRGRLNPQIKDPLTGKGYPYHDYIMALQHLIDEGVVVESVLDIKEKKKFVTTKKGKQKEVLAHPAHKFAFLGLPENDEKNEEWSAKVANKWVADIEKEMLK